MSVSSPGPAPAQSSPAIQLRGLLRHFHNRAGAVTKALDGVSLEVAQGEIFGIVGRSGAGKSTLIRCVNLLERPTQGEVRVLGEDLMLLDDAALRQRRRGIGMVFQHFNLLSSRTVAENVAFPLEVAGVPKAERTARVAEVLGLVGLAQKAENYPAQLSGGQKQRVGIARALAPRPRILLCDEATSALDPETTHDILGLIRQLRDKLDLTVLLITHEMAVVKEICDRVAVMEAGQVLEQGRVFDVFTRPTHPTTRSFIAGTIGHSVPTGTVARLPAPRPGEEKRLLQVLFAGPNSTRAVISEASRRYGIDLDIISGRIDEIAGEPFGLMALAAYGPSTALDEAVAWFEELGLVVTPLAEVI
ncbi:ATP-binding cassette domain-containing protein [Pseudoroseomonas wenyumeiae]|uniref:Cell division ATP-binding protein FtsE n=1 Tax=Teichococcus wenyumeiae TaxID=2478470 RepID=A0A3A9JFJ5_9PROT|nr:methionine ABC transporter ATP-binding protein [Pseudoroseomonas wenyumeiae]RKK05352.1 methionine ABC transporter ATP-binding protein [Pseudoroseomonas wenyumeiae]RMI25555.1 ATP-binding cassette domain-containing protein [Pseudoroseomonas wenyumeiae]